MAINAAMVSMPSQRFCRRRFSLAACWLSSWLAMGTVMVRVLAARSMASRGAVPPKVGRRMTLPRARSIAWMTAVAGGGAVGGVVDGRGGEGLLLDGGEGGDAVVEMRDEDVAVGVFHAGEELD